MKRLTLTLALAAALGLALAACGGSDPGGNGVASVGGDPTAGTSADPAAGLSQQEKSLKFVQCMRENGVEVPDPDPETGRVMMRFGPGTSQEKVQAAMQACKQWAPFGENGGWQNPEMQEGMRKYAQCMRDNGVEAFPDPQPGGGIRITPEVGNDPDFEAARGKCDSLLQGRQ